MIRALLAVAIILGLTGVRHTSAAHGRRNLAGAVAIGESVRPARAERAASWVRQYRR